MDISITNETARSDCLFKSTIDSTVISLTPHSFSQPQMCFNKANAKSMKSPLFKMLKKHSELNILKQHLLCHTEWGESGNFSL